LVFSNCDQKNRIYEIIHILPNKNIIPRRGDLYIKYMVITSKNAMVGMKAEIMFENNICNCIAIRVIGV
jgi:hypothetical protein